MIGQLPPENDFSPGALTKPASGSNKPQRQRQTIARESPESAGADPIEHVRPAYVARLRRGRYATNTSSRCLNGVAHFARWMSMCHLPVSMLDECVFQRSRTPVSV